MIEKNEELTLSTKATLSKNSLGREIYEEESDIRTVFQRDRDRIIHSKAFRRLKHKTQVFIAPEEDHYRTRLTHTLEVSQIARTIARSLRLNEDLTEAISLGHDLGHTPFGHSGEDVLNRLHPKGFKHYEQSIRVVSLLEQRKKGPGLNLTKEVLDGILNHSGKNQAYTEEGKLIKYADRIAYINHDIDDAIRAGVLRQEDLPVNILDILGHYHSKRIDTMIRDLVKNTYETGTLRMSDSIEEAMMSLRTFMFERVYLNPIVKSEEEKINSIITSLYEYYLGHIDKISKDHLKIYDNVNASKDDIVRDYIANMTDLYVIRVWKEIFEPKMWK